MSSRRKVAKTRADLPETWRKEMSDATLTELAGPTIFARGAAYFQQRNVELMRDEGGSVRFRVHGTETYLTDLHLQFVFAQPADALAARIWSAAARDRDPMAELKAWHASITVSGDPKALKAAITGMLSTGGRDLDWRGVSGYAEQGERILPLLQRALSEHLALAREACEHALQKLYKVASYADDSNGEIGGLMEAVMAVLTDALGKAQPDAKWADRFITLQTRIRSVYGMSMRCSMPPVRWWSDVTRSVWMRNGLRWP